VDARAIDRVLWEVAETPVDRWLHGLREHRELHLGDQCDRHDQGVNLMMDDLMKIAYLVFQIFFLRSSFLHSSLQSRSLYKCDINITV
jgi:hypothetical protein